MQTKAFKAFLSEEKKRLNQNDITDQLAVEILELILPKGKFSFFNVLFNIPQLSAKVFLYIQLSKPNLI